MITAAYIHIPFCEDICTYCDFCKYYYNKKFILPYLEALDKEIKKRYHGEVLKSIYVGGGTPSSLSLDELRILLKILSIFKINDAEYTFECNIENITEEKVKLLKEYGVNRLSIGVQTFNEKFLSYLNRKHTKDLVYNKIAMIKKYFNNINIDLIYAIPNETLEDLEEDLDNFLKLDIDHISTYSLIIEEHTILGNKKIMPVDEELDYQMYQLIINKLKDYEHYELSNFGKKRSRHNLVYWNNEKYYGFGLGASGYEGNTRYINTRSLTEYLNGHYRIYEEHLSLNTTIENYFILGLRKIKGINIRDFKKRYNIDIDKIDIINNLIIQDKLKLDNDNLYINPKYLYVSNDILVEFMGVDYERYIC